MRKAVFELHPDDYILGVWLSGSPELDTDLMVVVKRPAGEPKGTWEIGMRIRDVRGKMPLPPHTLRNTRPAEAIRYVDNHVKKVSSRFSDNLKSMGVESALKHHKAIIKGGPQKMEEVLRQQEWAQFGV